MTRFLIVLCPFILPVLAHAQYPGSTPPPDDLRPGFDRISVRKAREIDTWLATQCQGRGTGQPGFQKAADYVAAHFKAAGLKPMGENGTYFQFSTFYRTSAVDTKIETDQGQVLQSVAAMLNTPNHDVDVTGPVVVVVSPDATQKLSDDDAKKLDGKIVLQVVPAGRSALRSQVAMANTIATFMVAPTNPIFSPAVGRSSTGGGSSLVSGRMNTNVLGRVSPSIVQALDATPKPPTAYLIDPGRTLHITAKSKTEPVKVPNVVGLLEGTDPVLKDEYIGIGGHLDHLGINNGLIYPGADDDGSGSTAVMLIADAMAHNPHKPKRSILLMTFFGEEMGLLGSSYLTDHPMVPLNKMVSELQMDMVGRDSYGAQNGDPNRMDKVEENMDTMRLVGSKRISTDLDRIIQEQNEHIKFRFRYDAEDVYTRSDHYNFAKHGIPIAFLFDGFTPSYHQPTDTPDTMDWFKLASAARLYYLTGYAIADTDQAPRHDVKQ